MVKTLVLLSLGLGLAGCGGGQGVTVLSNEKFTAITLPGSPWVSTNTLARIEREEGGMSNLVEQASVKSKLIIPGTRLSIFVEEDPSLNKEFLIRPGSPIEYPPLGLLEVEGLTPEELAQIIEERLEKDYFHQATVTVKADRQVGGGVIYILGNVGRQGPIALPVNQKFTVLQAILAAGGPGAFGDESNIQVVRYGEDGKKYKTTVNLARIKKNAEFEKDIPLVNGDWLIVSEKLFNF